MMDVLRPALAKLDPAGAVQPHCPAVSRLSQDPSGIPHAPPPANICQIAIHWPQRMRQTGPAQPSADLRAGPTSPRSYLKELGAFQGITK